uniref:Uncharacterized protein n=1 Tax=Caenorhabditis japonica TaxID=281687 RepID=A0A8R1HPW7_CAEJA
MYEEWNECMRSDMQMLSTSTESVFWNQLENSVERCEQIELMRLLILESFSNLDETKYSMLPVWENTVITVVTIGIGQDVSAELQLQNVR